MNGAGGPAILGGDWPNPLPTVTTHGKPRPLPTGLDWDKHRAPDPESEPVMVETVAQAYASEVKAHTEAEERVEQLETRPAPQTGSENQKQRGPARSSRPKSTRTRQQEFEKRLEVQQPEILDTIREAYLVEEVSGDTIAARLGVSPNTVNRILRRNGIERRTRGVAGKQTSERMQDRILRLGTTSAEIRVWARANGIEVTRRGVLAESIVDLYEKAHQ